MPRDSFRRRPNILGNQKNRAARIANVAATPMTRWKWPVTKSSLTAAAARSWRARKIPESPPERKSEMKPSAKSMAVWSWTRAFQSVPSQLIRRTVAGSPREEAKSEKTSGEKGFMPLENMCWPQTQKPKTATPHNARTTRRSFQTGLEGTPRRSGVVWCGRLRFLRLGPAHVLQRHESLLAAGLFAFGLLPWTARHSPPNQLARHTLERPRPAPHRHAFRARFHFAFSLRRTLRDFPGAPRSRRRCRQRRFRD